MLIILQIALLVGVARGLFFGPATVHCDSDPIINFSTGATLDNLVDALVKEMDHNGDGNLDIDEVRDGLLGQFAGPDGMVTLQSFSSFSRKYHEDLSIADQFFHSMDMTGDGKLSELDFILQALTLDHDLSGIVTVPEFRRFIHMEHYQSVKWFESRSGMGLTCSLRFSWKE